MSDQEQDYGYEGAGYEGAYQEPMPGEGPRGSNVLGIVGFVLAFCVSPVGLIVSLIALAKPPRAFAIAGVVVGLLGTALWAVLGGGVWYAMSQPIYKIQQEVITDYIAITEGIEQYEASNDALPGSLADVGALSEAERTDPWGNPYVVEVSESGESWSLRVTGPDGEAGNEDDLVLDSGLEALDLAMEFQSVSNDWNKAAKAAEGEGGTP